MVAVSKTKPDAATLTSIVSWQVCVPVENLGTEMVHARSADSGSHALSAEPDGEVPDASVALTS